MRFRRMVVFLLSVTEQLRNVTLLVHHCFLLHECMRPLRLRFAHSDGIGTCSKTIELDDGMLQRLAPVHHRSPRVPALSEVSCVYFAH
jgi:hypothetical protein